ncbi:MAG: hypothetical protein ACJ79H_04400 [Myxococcales bacterium]
MGCFEQIHLCLVRVTRLDEIGNPLAEDNNVYVTNESIQLGVTPQVQAGDDKRLISGCDCVLARYRGNDKLMGFDLEFDLGDIEPALMELMLGASAIVDGPDVRGFWWPTQVSCEDAPQPNVCLEGWATAWDDDHQAEAPNRYAHWIWPSTRWQIGTHSLANDFLQPKLMGFTRGNPFWGMGIYGDQPEEAQPNGGMWWTDELPTADCGWQTQLIT